ncbi:MAG: NAD(+) synthase [Caulobacterales bacterium]
MAGKISLTERFKSLYTHGFVRVAAIAPRVYPAEPLRNTDEILRFARDADASKAAILLTPELSLSGYAIDDLLLQDALLDAVEDAIAKLKAESGKLFPLLIVGAPLRAAGALFNCAVVIGRGQILGVIPKSFLPNYREFYEKRHFAAAADSATREIVVCGERVPFGADLIFSADDARDFTFHVEVCEDLWSPQPPSTLGALAGAHILLNLSASNITIGKADDRAILCDAQSRRCAAAYVFAAAGIGESTNDLSWDGQVVGFELGEKIAEATRFSRAPRITLMDIDVERIAQERRRVSNFRDAIARNKEPLARFRNVAFTLNAPEGALPLKRNIARFPFVPDDPIRLDQDCFEAYNIQVEGLAKRIESTNTKRVVIGISGGLDSTHALIVIARAFDLLGLPRKNIIGVTMPGFATSDHTKQSAWQLMNAIGVDAREIPIGPLAQQMLADIGHPAAKGEKVYDVTYENVQAGIRTDILFRLANKEGGFVVGTGDLSELALGWCTYGVGDHMSHYGVNSGAPKTLIQHLIRWVIAANLFDPQVGETLQRVLDTEISPELVPGDRPQSTQAIIGPYALQDFNLYWITRFGFRPSKVLFLSWSAWDNPVEGDWPAHIPQSERLSYSYEDIRKWLGVFVTRFFGQSQYKRSAVPNGPKIVSGGALSPRGDWRAPSDASAAIWIDELHKNSPEKL